MTPAPDRAGALERWTPLVLMGVPLLLGFVLRLVVAPYFEFESAEDALRVRLLLEQGQLPLYGIGRIRFTDSALGPLIYYFKSVPYLLGGDPGTEVFYLRLLHLAGMAGLLWTVRRALGTGAAALLGLFWAISTFSIALSAMPHASFYSTGFMGLVIFFADQAFVRRRPRALIGLGLVVGCMTQFYQLTLFVPIWLLLVFLVYRPSLSARAWRWGFGLLLACYLPYLLSELLTGFANTRGLFAFTPGVGDMDMVQDTSLSNLGVLLTVLVDTWGLPHWCSGLILMMSMLGVGRLVVGTWSRLRRGTYRDDGVMMLVMWGLFFSLLPTFILGDTRYQMLSPFPQLLAALGLLTVLESGWRLTRFRQDTRAWVRPCAWGVIVALLVTANVLLADDPSYFWLYRRRIFPIWVAPGGDAHRVPSFPEVRESLQALHERAGLTVDNRWERLHGFWMGTGVYGEPFVLREVERRSQGPGPDDGTVLLVTDDLFRYDIRAAEEIPLDVPGRKAWSFQPRLDRSSFKVSLYDEEGRLIEERPHLPRVLYFGGCDNFRLLTGGPAPLPFDCERFLVRRPVRWRFEGLMSIPERRVGVHEVLGFQLWRRCAMQVRVQGRPLEVDWVWRARHAFGYAVIPPELSGRLNLEVEIEGCVPYAFDVFEFSGAENANILDPGEAP